MVAFVHQKFLGHGSCHNFSKTTSVAGSKATWDARLMADLGMKLFKEWAMPLDDVRGMGLVMSKLTTDLNDGKVLEGAWCDNMLTGWLSKVAEEKSSVQGTPIRSDNRACRIESELCEGKSKSSEAMGAQVDTPVSYTHLTLPTKA